MSRANTGNIFFRTMDCKIMILLIVSISFSFSLKGQVDKEDGPVKIYYPNGQVSSEGIIRDGKPDGYWITYYVTGIKKSEGKRNNFLLDSTWRFYNQGGELTQVINYKLGERSGYSITYQYKNPDRPGKRTIASKELYVNDKKEGESYYYYNTGELQRIVPYEQGDRQGIGKEFDKDSTIITLVQYNDDFVVSRERINRTDAYGRKQGTYKTFYENGQLKKEENYLDGQLNGYYREYDREGELIQAMRYEGGAIVEEIDEEAREIVDFKRTFDEEGRLVFSGAYREEIPIGIHRFYDTTGAVINAYIYNEKGVKVAEGIVDEQGNRKGKWIDYYLTGEIRAEGNYRNNRKNGSWTYYFRDGDVEQKGRFTNGRYEGKWIWYYQNGDVWREEHYFNGQQDGYFTEYDEKGRVITEGNYVNGEKDGVWKYQVGDHQEIGKFVFGLREGEWNYFYNDGTLKYEGSYIQGNPDGRHKYYYPNGNLKEEQFYEMGIRERNWKKFDKEGNLEMTITYKKNKEVRINGVKVRLPERDIKLIR